MEASLVHPTATTRPVASPKRSAMWWPLWPNCAMLLVASTVVVALQMLWYTGIGYNNIFVPDVDTYYNFLKDEFLSPDYFTLVFDVTPNPGVYILYYPFFLISDRLCIVPNFILMVLSLVLCVRLFHPFGSTATWLASLAVSLNPYTLLGITGPNKETALTFLVLLFVYSAVAKRSLTGVLLSLLVITLVRPLYAIIFLGCWFLILCFQNKVRFTSLVLLSPVLVAVFSQFIYQAPEMAESFFAAYSSADTPLDYYSVSLSGASNPLVALVMYLFRCLGNAFSTMVRFSPFTEEGEWALLGTGYGVYGMALAFGMMNLLFYFGSRIVSARRVELADRRAQPGGWTFSSVPSASLQLTALTVLFFWMCTSINFFIQSRYLMPILPVLFGILGATITRRRFVQIAAFLLVLAGLYFGAQWALAFKSAPPVIHESFKPEYLP